MKQRTSHRQIRRQLKWRAVFSRIEQWSKLLAVGHDDKAASQMIDFAGMNQTKLMKHKQVPGLPFGGDVAKLELHKKLHRGAA